MLSSRRKGQDDPKLPFSLVPNGKPYDNPLTDLVVHGMHPFPSDIEEMLLEIHEIGNASGRYPLGENWPYSPQEFDWEAGRNLEEAHHLLRSFVEAMRGGWGEEIMVDPITKRPLRDPAG